MILNTRRVVKHGSNPHPAVRGLLKEGESREIRKGGKPVSLLLLILLIVLLVGAIPAWPYSRSWGYYPSGGVGLLVLILIILLLTGRL